MSTLPHVIYDFVSQSEFRVQSVEQRNPENRSKLRVAHVSNFRPVKNAQSLASVFIGIRKQIDSELWLIGDGEELAVVKSMLRQKGFENDVRCWGLKCQVTAILAQTDMLLVTSHYESFCLVALEAMACGVPVVAPRVGGIPEVVVHGRTGFLFEQGDLSAAVEHSVAMLSDANHRQSISKAALDRARRFRQDKIVPEYEALYKRLFYSWESSSGYG
jgi:N-acetyl-alpha-D-glucosaminyl L-malate synthase BshA